MNASNRMVDSEERLEFKGSWLQDYVTQLFKYVQGHILTYSHTGRSFSGSMDAFNALVDFG